MSTPFEICPYDAPLGAEIRGLELSEPLPKATIDALRDTWHEYLVLVFRGQAMSDEQQFAFTTQFGALEHTPQKLLELAREGRVDESAPEITVISNVIENGVALGRLGNSEALWHSDSNFAQVPPAASILRAVEVPSSGGNTGFMNMYQALTSLPMALRSAIDKHHAKHDPTFDSAGRRRPEYADVAHPAQGPGPIHPLIRTHPGSGKQVLYLGRRAGAYVMDMDVAQSELLLDAIWAHVVDAEITWTHRWRAGDVLMWDNRCTMHRRDAFDSSVRRVMHRTQLAGDRPR
ncbi:MAG: taurine dioxygenase [Gammaproteobacteria bacterium]|jgi:taurine dioxygenase